ncbi:MAG: hypothetical protein IPJ88_14110 [Myxococcales bacterium]|nr:MAG: hypothetical protein IPJ88_14110 [Myxococcales bacterium]
MAERSLQGYAGYLPKNQFLQVLRWLSGLALLSASFEALAFLLRTTRKVRVELSERRISVHRQLTILGKPVRETHAEFPVSSVRAVVSHSRYPYVYLIAGAFALVLGAVLGIRWFSQGLGSADVWAISVGLFFLLAGISFDLLLNLLVPGLKKHHCLDIYLQGGPDQRIAGLDEAELSQWLTALRNETSAVS